MKHKLCLLCLLSLVSFFSYAQVANTPPNIVICDGNNDGFEIFDLTSLTSSILGGQNPVDFSVRYYYDAGLFVEITGSDLIAFSNTSNPQTIFAKVTEVSTGDFDTTNFEIQVLPSPIVNVPEPIILCDDNLDGFETFNLTSSENEITGGSTDVSVAYYLTLSDAQTSQNQISNPMSFSNTVPNSQIIFVHVESLITSCFAIVELTLEAIDCTDTDSDGVIDADEDINGNGNLNDDDTDGDMTPNYQDDDDDGDNVDTIVEINNPTGRRLMHAFVDTDGDMTENYLDDDDDDDGVLTKDEDYNNNGDPTDDDTNSNSIPDYLEASVALSVANYTQLSFSLFPNPAKAQVNIHLFHLNNTDNITVKIYDVSGKLFLEKQHYSNEENLDISKLSSGLYFVKVSDKNNSIVQKLIVK